MPIISDPYNDQRNTLTQSIMRQAIPGFLRQLNPSSIPGYGRTDFEGGTTGGGVDAVRGMQPLSQDVLQRNAGRGNMMSPQQIQQINAQPSMMPGTVPSAQPQMNPGMSMPPPQPPQQMMPLSQPPIGQMNPTAAPPSMSGGAPDNFGYGSGGTSVGSKGAGATPPTPAAMKAGM